MVYLVSPSSSSQGSEVEDHDCSVPLIQQRQPDDCPSWSWHGSLDALADSSPSQLRRNITRGLLLVFGIFAIILGLTSSSTIQQTVHQQGLLAYAKDWYQGTSYYQPSASALPPALSILPPSLKRITLVAVWSSDNRPFYLNNFFRSAALNSDVADLLVIHVTNDHGKCLDGKNELGGSDGIDRDAAWDWENGGNIRVVCLSREALIVHEADYLCSKDMGWGCTEGQLQNVTACLHERQDNVNSDWKPLRGEMFKQYFIHPKNPLWAWTDMDMHLGRLSHIPFSLLSTVSMISPRTFTPSLLFLAGQMTLFNVAAPGFVGAWKRYAPLSTPERFCRDVPPEEGGFPEGGNDESWLSAAYLRHDKEGYAGLNLSWAMIPDVHGQDLFVPGRKFVVSGRDVLEVDAELSRGEIEAVLEDAANEPIDEYSGWSERGVSKEAEMHVGEACHKAWFTPDAAQCVEQDPLSVGDQFTEIDSVRRGTVLRIGTDEPNLLHLRLEPDRRPRRWQRKLFLHYQEIKRQTWWWGLPDYFIGGEGEVMEFDWRAQYIWKKGDARDVNIWERRNDRLNEDGTSQHTHPLQTDPERRMKMIRRSARMRRSI